MYMVGLPPVSDKKPGHCHTNDRLTVFSTNMHVHKVNVRKSEKAWLSRVVHSTEYIKYIKAAVLLKAVVFLSGEMTIW